MPRTSFFKTMLFFLLAGLPLVSCSVSRQDTKRPHLEQPQQRSLDKTTAKLEREKREQRKKEAGKEQEIEQIKDAKKRKAKGKKLFVVLKNAYKKRNFRKANSLIKRYLKRYPAGEYSGNALFFEADILFKKKDYDKAIKRFTTLIKNYPDSKFIDTSRLQLGFSYLQYRFWDRAIFTFDKLLTSPTLSTSVKFNVYKMKAHALIKKAKYVEAVTEYRKAYSYAKKIEQVKDVEKKMIALIEQKITWEYDLLEVINILAGSFGEPYSQYKLASLQYEKGDFAPAFFTLKRFQNKFPDHEYSEKVDHLLQEINTLRGPQEIKIGCLVPLTGKSAYIGRRILKGVQLAFSETDRDEGIKVVVKDSSGDSESLKAAIQELASDKSVLAIIGPTFSSEIESAVPIAKQEGIMLFTPTAASSKFEGYSPFLFRNSVTAKNEANYMAEIAIDYLGLTNIAIFHQNDKHGIEISKFFKEKVESLGGYIVEEVPFETDKSDFGRQIRKLGGITDSRIKRLLKKGKSLPDFNYDGIYIPGNAATVGLILPQLAYYNINNIPILGGSGLNSPDIIKSGNLYSNLLLFTSAFFKESKEEAMVSFIKKFKIFFNAEPDIVSAQSFDTAKMLISLLRKGYLTREDMRKGLVKLKNHEGVSGVTSFDHSGDAQKNLYLLTVNRGRVKRIREQKLPNLL